MDTNISQMQYIESNVAKYTFDPEKNRKVYDHVRMIIGTYKNTIYKNEGKTNEFKILNLFAGKTLIWKRNEVVRNDIDPEMPELDYNTDAEALVKIFERDGVQFDIIIYDPAWNDRKAKEFYGLIVETTTPAKVYDRGDGKPKKRMKRKMIGKYTKYKENIVNVLKMNGIIISAGYEITNFGKKRNMKLVPLLSAVVDPKGEQRPYFISVEMKVKDEKLVNPVDLYEKNKE